MIRFLLTGLWLLLLGLALAGSAGLERHARLAGVAGRRELEMPRREWGFDRDEPPGSRAGPRLLAAAARLVRGRSRVAETSVALERVGRMGALIAIASAFSLLSLAGQWAGAPEGPALVLVDLPNGLLILVFLILLANLARVAAGLAERNVFARLAAVRLAGRTLLGGVLLLVVLAPLVLAAGSLRIHEIVLLQQADFAPLAFLAPRLGSLGIEGVEALRLPGWLVFRQPLTALLAVPALGILLRRPCLPDALVGGGSWISGFGLDADPQELYWLRLDVRLSRVLAAAIFVTLFLGAGGIPYLDVTGLMARLSPMLGVSLPALLFFGLEVGVFAAKLGAVLLGASLVDRSLAAARSDQTLQRMTRRLMPLAWANLLLVCALTLLADALAGGLAR